MEQTHTLGTINRQYKDRLFTKIFGAPENKNNLLSLYNALNDTSYTNKDELELYTLEDVVYMGMRNDVSCIIDSYMPLYEHQSTLNPNMPLRGLLYFGKSLSKYVSDKKLPIYSSKLQKIPTPQFYIFYNGLIDTEDRIIMKLSEAFTHPMAGHDYEWSAVMLNINHGRNQKLMKKCQVLEAYARLVNNVRKYSESGTLDQALDQAVTECINENGPLSSYLKTHRAEVIDVCLTEYNEEEVMQMFRKEIREEALMEGEAIGLSKGLDQGLSQGLAQGLAQGISQGLARLQRVNQLNALLVHAKRYEELMRAAEDPDYQQSLLAEFGLLES